MSGAATSLRCASCGATYRANRPLVECERCAGLLDAIHRAPTVRGAALRARFDARARAALLTSVPEAISGVWRFRELVLPAASRRIVSQPEGNTPLVQRDAVADYAGVADLRLKLEGMNPTGSFKDRGMTVAITQAVRMGVRAVACASTGNTSASLASYAGLAGIPAVVLVPAGKVAAGKLAQTRAYGAHTIAVRGNFDDCLRLARVASGELGVYLVNSVNPFRVEGQKSVVFEILQQLAWDAPDWIAVPAGNLGNTAAIGAAIAQARALGLVRKSPRVVAVQAAGAAPFAASFADDFRTHGAVRPRTIASAIRIGDPASWDRAVATIRSTGGVVVSVSDDDLVAAKRVIDACGVGCEPASAASVAGVRALVTRGVIRPSDSVACVLTGHLLKHPEARGSAGGRDVEIEPRVADFERALGRFIPG